MRNKLGFIGCGKMANAIINGVLNSGFFKKDEIFASVKTQESLNSNKDKLGINLFLENKSVVDNADVVFLSIKPHFIRDVLNQTKESFNKNKLIVSVAAGIKTSTIEEIVGDIPVIRVMPNTPMFVNEGMCGVCKGKFATDEDLDYVVGLLSKTGKTLKISEAEIDALTAISGCGPAFFYMFFDEMAKAGEKIGLKYEDALVLSAQTALGSAKMVLETNTPTEVLINNVATKGGSTEVGVNYLKSQNIAKLFEELIQKTAQKSKDLGN